MLKEIEELLKKIGGRFIIVEEGSPRYVILDFEDFKILAGCSQTPGQDQNLEKVDEKLLNMKEQKEDVEPEIPEEDDVRVEDIPLQD